MKSDDNSAKVTFPPPLVFIGFLLAGLVIDDIAGLDGFGLPLSLRLLLAAAMIGPGIALIFSALGGFRKAGTPPEPWREVTAFVASGVYRFTRNPMYLGMAAISLGLTVALESIAALLLLPLAIIAIRTQVIAREETCMRQLFGTPFTDYCKRVRRWL